MPSSASAELCFSTTTTGRTALRYRIGQFYKKCTPLTRISVYSDSKKVNPEEWRALLTPHNMRIALVPSKIPLEAVAMIRQHFSQSDELLGRVGGLFNTGEMSDVTLVVGSREFPVHRLILCSSSEVFQVMLLSRNWNEAQASRVQLQETEQCIMVFDKFLQFFYTGCISIDQTMVLPILCLADKYNVKALMDLCLDYMMVHVAHGAKHGLLVSWLQYTLTQQTPGHTKAAQVLHNFIKWNFELISKASDFGQFEPDVFISLLQQDDLVIYDEMRLFNCVVRWLDLQMERLTQEGVSHDHEGTTTALVEGTMAHIRFPMMSPRQLAELLLYPLTQIHKEFLVQRMALGMAFHSGQNKMIREAVQEEGMIKLFTPRLYTVDTWSAVLTIDNYSMVQPYHSRTLVFSSPRSCAEHRGDRSCEWVVDLYPRGVWFQKFKLIVWQGVSDVPEAILRMMRLAVTCKDPEGELHVRIGVLVYSGYADVEHVHTVLEKTHYFEEEERVLNFNDLLPFDSVASSNLLLGPHKDTFKVQIIIAPCFDLSATN